MSAEALSGIGSAVGSVGSVGAESMAPAFSPVMGIGESMGSLGNLSPEPVSVPLAFENAFASDPMSTPSDISVFEKGFAEPTDFSVFEKAFADPVNSSMEVTEDGFRDAIKGINIEPTDFSVFERAYENPVSDLSTEITDDAFRDAIKDIQIEPADMSIFEKGFEPSIQSLSNETETEMAENLVEVPQTDSNTMELTPLQVEGVKADLEVAKDVKELLINAGFESKTASEISHKSLEIALERKGISLKTFTQSGQKEEPESALETEEENQVSEEVAEVKVQTKNQVSSAVQTRTEVKQKTKEKEKSEQPQEILIFVKDEEANQERKKDAEQAISKTFSDNETEKNGVQIVSRMNSAPTAAETSELVRKFAANADGSYEEVLEDINSKRFFSKNEAAAAISSVIEQKPAVKLSKSGKVVSEKDVKRVLKTNYPTLAA